MFDNKKYVFETRRTRMFRYIQNICILILVVIFIYVGFAGALVLVANSDSDFAEKSLERTPPDLVVVFTGSKGRIPYAFKKAAQYEQSNILISGVHDKNSVETLVAPTEFSDKLNPDFLDIDYSAKNTVENVQSTINYLEGKKGLKRILIISHDYHIPRIRVLFKYTTDIGNSYELFYSSISSDYYSYKDVKIILKEVYKFLGALLYSAKHAVY